MELRAGGLGSGVQDLGIRGWSLPLCSLHFAARSLWCSGSRRGRIYPVDG